MNTSAFAPASICRARTELEANDVLTATPEVFCQSCESSPRTLVSDAAANTSTSLCFVSCATTGSPNDRLNIAARAIVGNRRVMSLLNMVMPAWLWIGGPVYTPEHCQSRWRRDECHVEA